MIVDTIVIVLVVLACLFFVAMLLKGWIVYEELKDELEDLKRRKGEQ